MKYDCSRFVTLEKQIKDSLYTTQIYKTSNYFLKKIKKNKKKPQQQRK